MMKSSWGMMSVMKYRLFALCPPTARRPASLVHYTHACWNLTQTPTMTITMTLTLTVAPRTPLISAAVVPRNAHNNSKKTKQTPKRILIIISTPTILVTTRNTKRKAKMKEMTECHNPVVNYRS